MVDHLCYFCIVFVMLSRLLIAALWSPAGKGLTSWLLFVVLNCVVVTFPFGILGQVWYLIVSTPDLCPISDFNTVRILEQCPWLLNFAYSYKMVCNFTKNKQKYAKHSIHSLNCILHYAMPFIHNQLLK